MTTGVGDFLKAQPESNEKGPDPLSRWFALPAPVKLIFDIFPIQFYPANHLPQRSPKDRERHVLYVFAHEADEISFNPACLRWQAYLKFQGVDFRTCPANNHASPSGSLPFLLPAFKHNDDPRKPVAAGKLMRWCLSQKSKELFWNIYDETYLSLVDSSIRDAWLYTLYLDDANFQGLATSLYVRPASSHTIVRVTLKHQLRQAARAELLKKTVVVDPQVLFCKADDAFHALSTLLGEADTFSGVQTPGLLDAALFAHSCPLLDDTLGWKSSRMTEDLKKYTNLVNHRSRLLKRYFEV